MKRVTIKQAAEAAPLILALALMLAAFVVLAVNFESEPFRAWVGAMGLGGAGMLCFLYFVSLQPADSRSMDDGTPGDQSNAG